MKNISLFPMIRNKYFYGKLLTARDFELEQEYINNKRRLINSMMFGTGVVCGLSVTKVDGASITVESGLALDGTGRELALAHPVILRLSDLEGFEDDTGHFQYVYLCAEYSELDKEPVHGIADNADAEDRYNKSEESCHFFLLYAEPEHENGEETYSGKLGREAFYGKNMERLAEHKLGEKLYLARIGIVRWGNAYEIGEIEQIPFDQYIVNAEILNAVCKKYLDEPERIEEVDSRDTNASEEFSANFYNSAESVRSGVVSVNILTRARSGDVFFSDDIPHGFGPGETHVLVSFISQGMIVYGARGIFKDNNAFDSAVRVDIDNGTFRVGIKAVTAIEKKRLDFRWVALRDVNNMREQAETKRVLIKPDISYLVTRETLQFEKEVFGLADDTVKWTVAEKEGGSIDENGFYTAPNSAGVFEVIAVSEINSKYRASAFVVVKEK